MMYAIRRSSSKSSRLAIALIVLGIALGVLAIGLSLYNRHATPRPPAGSAVSESAPSSLKPKPQEIASYSVHADNPKYLAIPAINIVNTRIMRLGLTKDDQVAVPDNIYDAGWYDGSVKPGQTGAMFIYGHVSSWTADGVFYNLKKLRPGDKIVITRGDNQKLTYQVNSSKVYDYDKVDMNAVLAPIDPGKPGLNLMTCTGKIIKGTSEFNERLVVFASLVNS